MWVFMSGALGPRIAGDMEWCTIPQFQSAFEGNLRSFLVLPERVHGVSAQKLYPVQRSVSHWLWLRITVSGTGTSCRAYTAK